jgi:uncharacterized protein (DUF2147 family)
MKLLILLAAISSASLALSNAACADPIGNWRDADGDAVVRIQDCGSEALCGYVASAADPTQRDMRNPDPSQRDRTIIGMEVLIDLKKQGPDVWTGTSYNAEIGQTFSAKLTQKGDDTVDVEGCAPGGGNCGTETWTRVKD